MLRSTPMLLLGLIAGLRLAGPIAAQPIPALPGAQMQVQPPPAQAPPGFQLNRLEQTNLDLVLNAWQQHSAQINTFRCEFDRLDYNFAFGPAPNIALFVNKGELSFERPDKGSFQITEMKKWRDDPVPPGQPPPAERTGTHVVDPQAVGEHWVCDGKSIYEYRHIDKQLVVRPIPPQMQGQSIVDGPLPFLFGAEPAKLKARYWLRINSNPPQPVPNAIYIEALPRAQADAANYSQVDVILDRQQFLPKAMQVHLPDRSRNVYLFKLEEASINSRWEQIKALLTPPVLRPGWKRVVKPMPQQQAARAAPPPR